MNSNTQNAEQMSHAEQVPGVDVAKAQGGEPTDTELGLLDMQTPNVSRLFTPEEEARFRQYMEQQNAALRKDVYGDKEGLAEDKTEILNQLKRARQSADITWWTGAAVDYLGLDAAISAIPFVGDPGVSGVMGAFQAWMAKRGGMDSGIYGKILKHQGIDIGIGELGDATAAPTLGVGYVAGIVGDYFHKSNVKVANDMYKEVEKIEARAKELGCTIKEIKNCEVEKAA